MADAAFARRVAKLIVFRDKMDLPPESTVPLINASFQVDNKISGMSEKETADCLISMTPDKERREQVSLGLLYGLLTDKDNFAKHFHSLSVIASDQWYATLCNVNMILIEIWPKLLESCKDQLLMFFREAIKLNVPKIDNVIMNLVRTLNGSGDWNSKLRVTHAIVTLLNENEAWLMSLKPGPFLCLSALTTFGHLIVDIPPGGPTEATRQAIIQLIIFIIRNRFNDACLLGRDLVLILMRLAKIPQFQQVWKDLVNTPAKFGLTGGIEELMFRSNPQFHSMRLAVEASKKIDFIICQVKPNMQDKHYEWFANAHLKGPDAGSLRAEMIRYTLHFFKSDMPSHVLDNRVHFLYFLLVNTNAGVELQWCKTALWFDWLTFDAGCPIHVIEPVLALVRYTLNAQPPKANALMEYLCKSVSQLHPPCTESVKRAANAAMKLVADHYGQGGVSPILENVRLERSVREGIREIFRDFVRNSAPSIPQTSSIGTPPVTSLPNNSGNGRKDKEKPGSKEDDKEKERKSPSPVDTKSRPMKKEDITAELNSTLRLLRVDLLPTVEALRESFQSEDADEGEKGEAVQRLLQKLLENEDPLEDDQLELIALCLLFVMGSVVEEGKSILPDPPTEENIQESFSHPLFIIFRNLCFTPEADSTTRTPMVTIIAAMRDRDNTITYLMLYFMKAGLGSTNGECISCYEEVARACDKDVDEMLAADLQQCALDDDRLFAYLVPFVFEKFAAEAGSSPEVFGIVCSQLDAKQLMELVGEVVRENVTLFRKDSFSQIVSASLEWETTAQWAFWQLVHAEGIPVDWLTQLIPKLKSLKNAEAATNVLLMLKRIDREPNMNLMRSILARTPSVEDTFTVNALKILIEDSDMCTKVAELLGNLMKKQISAGDLLMLASAAKAQGKKGPQKLSMEQVLSHIEHFTQLCLTKEKKVAEALLSKTYVQDAFNAAKTCDKAASLRPKFSQLFAVVEILSEESQQSSRTLRGNRSTAPKPKRIKDDDKDDDQPNKKKRRTVIVLDSDSD